VCFQFAPDFCREIALRSQFLPPVLNVGVHPQQFQVLWKRFPRPAPPPVPRRDSENQENKGRHITAKEKNPFHVHAFSNNTREHGQQSLD
jgi:hypothetical protein